MHRALLELTVHGIQTSRDFHLRVMEDADFRAGAIEIQWLERRLPLLVGTTPPADGVRTAAIAAALLAHRDRTGTAVSTTPRGPNTNGAAAGREDVSRDGWKDVARREAVSDRW
jgi:acetyl-CoA carboxylase biotin carboxylase subunit